MGRTTKKSNVILLDFETDPAELASRVESITKHYGASDSGFLALPFMDTDKDAFSVLSKLEPGDAELVILDCQYCAFHLENENESADVLRVYRQLKAESRRLKAGLIVVHHTRKGGRTNATDTIDMGAGSGASARLVSNVIGLRHHKFHEHYVLDAVTRSSPKFDSLTLEGMSIGAALVFKPQPDIKAELCGLNPQVHRELTASERAEMEALTSEFMGPRRPDVSEPDLRVWSELRKHTEPNTKSGFAHLVHGKIRKPKIDGKAESQATVKSLVEQAVSSGCLRPATSDDGKPLHRSAVVSAG